MLDKNCVVLIKKFLQPDLCQLFIKDLQLWAQSENAKTEVDLSSKRILNAHLKLKSNGNSQRKNLDFQDQNIAIEAHNFRIGDINTNFCRDLLKNIYSSKSILFDAFYHLIGKRNLLHGTKNGKNLYLEFVNFPPETGFVDEHTHESIAELGLDYIIVGLLTNKGEDYGEGGVHFIFEDGTLDLSNIFEKGDLLIFNSKARHYVDQIKAQSPRDLGRWIYTFFYY